VAGGAPKTEKVVAVGTADRRRRHVRGYEDEAVSLSRLQRDFRAAERTIERRRIANELSRAQGTAVAFDPVLYEDLVIAAEAPITLTAQQFFLVLAQRYATNEQIAAFLYGRVTEKSLGAVRRALHALRQVSDEDLGAMGLHFTRPAQRA